MKANQDRNLFAVVAPGLEPLVADELKQLGVSGLQRIHGGVIFAGDRALLMRANLRLRCATRVLLRIGNFMAFHLAQLDRRAHQIPWAQYLPANQPFRDRASCHRSRIYHHGAAAERVGRAISDTTGARPADTGQEAIEVLVRISKDRCLLSLDSSGPPLYRRGYKTEVTQAPLRETLASGVLRICGYQGQEPLLDPMCGSASFLLEAAGMAMGRAAGRDRKFAFMDWPDFDPDLWQQELALCQAQERAAPAASFFASDGNSGALGIAQRNLERAALAEFVTIERCLLADLQAPAEHGLLICNAPYGKRLGQEKSVGPIYAELGRVFRERFSGWRLGLVTSKPRLAEQTGLRFSKVSPPILHGGIRICVYQC